MVTKEANKIFRLFPGESPSETPTETVDFSCANNGWQCWSDDLSSSSFVYDSNYMRSACLYHSLDLI